MDLKNVLFVQRSAHKAGAQHCLARILRQLGDRDLDPLLLTGEDGWLAQECVRHQIRVIRLPFPSSRSLPAHLYGNAAFVRGVRRELRRIGCRPPIVHGNDHPEALLTLELARVLQAKSSLTLRTSSMTCQDYSKYRCADANLLISVSHRLSDSVRKWNPGREVVVIPDGLADNEFLCPQKPLTTSPSRVLVLGSASPRKGWQDLLAALDILRETRRLPTIHLDFTDQRPSWLRKPPSAPRWTLSFIGHQDDFRDLVRRYDLVINPSRSESFGMAALEVIAAGVPLLSSRSGVIEEIIKDPQFLFEPQNPRSLATALHRVLIQWPVTEHHLQSNQDELHDRYHIQQSMEQLLDRYGRLLA